MTQLAETVEMLISDRRTAMANNDLQAAAWIDADLAALNVVLRETSHGTYWDLTCINTQKTTTLKSYPKIFLIAAGCLAAVGTLCLIVKQQRRIKTFAVCKKDW